MSSIEVTPLYALEDGRAIKAAVSAGSVATGINKAGADVMAIYDAGSLFLTDRAGRVIVGPIDRRGAYNLALAVANGDPHAITDPQAIHVLAVSLIAALADEIAPGMKTPPLDGDQT